MKNHLRFAVKYYSDGWYVVLKYDRGDQDEWSVSGQFDTKYEATAHMQNIAEAATDYFVRKPRSYSS